MRMTLAFANRALFAVILAAGGSKRLGRPKQLLRYRRMPLILNAVRLARTAVGDRIIVVLGARHHCLRNLLNRHDRRLRSVNNPRWRAGLSTSLRTGIEALPSTASAALILLVDQPKLEPKDLGRLVASWQKRPRAPVAARYLGRAGVPAIIPRRRFREVASLQGDVGARHVLRGLGDLTLVDMPRAAFDVDTPADAINLKP